MVMFVAALVSLENNPSMGQCRAKGEDLALPDPWVWFSPWH